MFPRVTSVQHVRDYKVQISFSDGTVANLDLEKRVKGRGGVFSPLQDIGNFARVVVDREAGTLVWPNGVDFCPDVLYADATGRNINDLGHDIEVA